MANTHPKLHNAAWPGVVGKGPDSEPPVELDTMLDLTAAAEVDGVTFDGFDLFLYEPHISIDADKEELQKLADKAADRNLVIGSVVAPIWPETDGGSAMGDDKERKQYLTQVRKGCAIGQVLREIGIRPYGVVRIDSAAKDLTKWAADPEGNQARIADTFREACDIAEDYGERLAAEGEICWGGMHSWKKMVQLLELVDRPKTLGFQADMSHLLTYLLGINAPEDGLLETDFTQEQLDEAWQLEREALQPWTIDFHVSQSDGTTHGSGSHFETGKHSLANDPNGKLNICKHAGMWLRDDQGMPIDVEHICWDGCMFSNSVMMQPQTWELILAEMFVIREVHGWSK